MIEYGVKKGQKRTFKAMKFDFDANYFNPTDVLECGQLFRFIPHKKGYIVCSADKACYVYSDGVKTTVESDYPEYFYDYFDLDRDYKSIVGLAKSFDIPVLTHCAEVAKGLRLLRQNAEETIFSFIISQNNNIPRIKGIIERICSSLGERREFSEGEYYTFPSAQKIGEMPPGFYRALGAGYRDEYLSETGKRIGEEGIGHLKTLDEGQLKKALLGYKGIGPKVADCICLFGFYKAANFPVDTWIEKIYREDFGGTLKDRKKINEYFCTMFGKYAGFIQQYLFYGKRANL